MFPTSILWLEYKYRYLFAIIQHTHCCSIYYSDSICYKSKEADFSLGNQPLLHCVYLELLYFTIVKDILTISKNTVILFL